LITVISFLRFVAKREVARISATGGLNLRMMAREMQCPTSFSIFGQERHAPPDRSNMRLIPFQDRLDVLSKKLRRTWVKPSLSALPSVGPGLNGASSGTATVVFSYKFGDWASFLMADLTSSCGVFAASTEFAAGALRRRGTASS
jgi:hypothetical protein